jgi:hypothetical protein
MDYDTFADARLDYRLAENDHKRRAAARRMLETAREALEQSISGARLDPEIARWLANVIHDMLANRVIDVIKNAKQPGIADSIAIKQAKRIAVTYRQAVAARDIEDPSPSKTIQSMFRCDSEAVRKWTKQHPSDLWLNFWNGEDLEIRRKRLLRSLAHGAQVMREASKSHYAIASRTKSRQGVRSPPH